MDAPQKTKLNMSYVALGVLILVTFFTALYDKGMNSGIPLYYDEIGYSAAIGGSFVAVFTIASMVMRLVGGQITDHFTHYKVLVASLGAMLIGALIPAFSDEFYVVMVSRVLQGAGFALASNTMTVAVMGTASKKHLGRRVGLKGAGTSLGTMLGAVVAVWLLHNVGFQGFFGFYTIIIVISIIVILLLRRAEVKYDLEGIEGSKPSEESKNSKNDKAATSSTPAANTTDNASTGTDTTHTEAASNKVKKSLKELIAPYLMPQVFPYLALGFARRLPKGFCVSFILIFAKHVGIEGGATFFVLAGATTLICRLTLGKLFDSNKTWLVLPMLCVELIGFIILAAAPSFATLMIAAVGYGITIGTISPFLKTLTAKSVPKEHWGAVNGELYFFSDLGKALGAFLGGVIIDATAKSLIPEIAVGFAIAPCVLAVIALLFSRWQSKKATQNQT